MNKEEHFTTTDTIDEVNKLISNIEDHFTLRSLHTKYNASFFDPTDEIVYNKETLGFRLESQAEVAMLKHIATSTEHHIGHSLIHFAWNLSQTMIKGHESGKPPKKMPALYLLIHSLRRRLILISQKKKENTHEFRLYFY